MRIYVERETIKSFEEGQAFTPKRGIWLLKYSKKCTAGYQNIISGDAPSLDTSHSYFSKDLHKLIKVCNLGRL